VRVPIAGTLPPEGGVAVGAKVAKVIELVGESTQSWEAAVQSAVSEAGKTLHGITGVEVTNWTAEVKNGHISEYKVDLKLAFGVDSSGR
jgi:flavin-binding protein dodecin